MRCRLAAAALVAVCLAALGGHAAAAQPFRYRVSAPPAAPAPAANGASSRDLAAHTLAEAVEAQTMNSAPVEVEQTQLALMQGKRVSLSGPGSLSRWAYVLQAASAHVLPAASSRRAGDLPTITSDAMPNLVHVIAERLDVSGRRWVQVALTMLPNGRAGWVPRASLGTYRVVGTRLVVDTGGLKLTLFRGGHPIFSAPIGVGQRQWPTPHGTFYVRERLTNFNDAAYGPIAFGTNARSTTLTDWPGGGVVGIHGTDTPSLIPGRISHGCIRLRNADIIALSRLLPLGTPIEIR